jgi:hypothetical protein
LREELDRLVEQRETLRERARRRGCEFVGLDDEELLRKLRGETSNSPFFSAYAWDQFTNAGSESFILANYFNPDPVSYTCVVSLFFGVPLGPDVSSEIRGRDMRWPIFSTAVVGLDPSELGIADIKCRVPFVSRGTYFGTAVLWNWLIGSGGQFFDRTAPLFITLK